MKKYIRLLAVVIGILSCLLALGIVESMVRLFYPEAKRHNILAELEREIKHWNRPDAQFHHVGEGIYKLRFPSPSGGTKQRIMIVGDSFAMGHGVGENYRFGTLLQQDYGERAVVDVLATSSYSPIIYRNIIAKAMSVMPYSDVVVFVDQTDPADDLIYREDLLEPTKSSLFNVADMLERENLVDRTYAQMIEGMSGQFVIRRLAVFNLLNPVFLLRQMPKESKHYHYVELSLRREFLIDQFEIDAKADVTRQMEALLFSHLDQIVAMCNERKTRLFLVANPWEYQVSKAPRVSHGIPKPYPRENRLEEIIGTRYSSSAGVAIIPLTRYFREQSNPSSLFLDRPANEIHWNRAGHVLVEKVIREFLSKQGQIGQQ